MTWSSACLHGETPPLSLATQGTHPKMRARPPSLAVVGRGDSGTVPGAGCSAGGKEPVRAPAAPGDRGGSLRQTLISGYN